MSQIASVAAVRTAAPFVALAIMYMCVRSQVLGFDNLLGNVLGTPSGHRQPQYAARKFRFRNTRRRRCC